MQTEFGCQTLASIELETTLLPVFDPVKERATGSQFAVPGANPYESFLEVTITVARLLRLLRKVYEFILWWLMSLRVEQGDASTP